MVWFEKRIIFDAYKINQKLSKFLINPPKTMKNIFFYLACIVLAFSFNACKTKKLTSVTGATEVVLPFSEDKYETSKDFFRARNTGKSPDLATSKKIALLNAKSELASNINSVIKKVSDQYINQRSVENKQEFESKFEELTREVVSQSLIDVKVMEEKLFKETDGSYSYWVVIEVSKQSILEGVNNKISKNAKLQVDYDKKKYEEDFNSEMEKLSNEK